MPRLLTIAACDKIVKDASGGSISLVNIIEEVHVAIPVEVGPPPEGAHAPREWAMFTLWERQDGEESRSFEVEHKLLGPNGQNLLPNRAVLTMSFEASIRNQVIAQFNAFPVWAPGRCEAIVEIRALPDGEFAVAGTYPIAVMHDPPDSPVFRR